jgi:hypothetical protein
VNSSVFSHACPNATSWTTVLKLSSPTQLGGWIKLVFWKLRMNSLTIGYHANTAKQISATQRNP